MKVATAAVRSFAAERDRVEAVIAGAVLRGDEDLEWKARRYRAAIAIRFANCVNTQTGEWK